LKPFSLQGHCSPATELAAARTLPDVATPGDAKQQTLPDRQGRVAPTSQRRSGIFFSRAQPHSVSRAHERAKLRRLCGRDLSQAAGAVEVRQLVRDKPVANYMHGCAVPLLAMPSVVGSDVLGGILKCRVTKGNLAVIASVATRPTVCSSGFGWVVNSRCVLYLFGKIATPSRAWRQFGHGRAHDLWRVNNETTSKATIKVRDCRNSDALRR
jgi:hypothetical protein